MQECVKFNAYFVPLLMQISINQFYLMQTQRWVKFTTLCPTNANFQIYHQIHCSRFCATNRSQTFTIVMIVGADVKLQCNNTRLAISRSWFGKTDKHGYFFIIVPRRLTAFRSHKCTVSLVSSPNSTCQKPTNLFNGAEGAMLVVPKKPRMLPFQLFTVGPFAYEPESKCL